MKSLNTIQAEHRDWAARNFPGCAPHEPVLGIGEEVGELSEAFDRAEAEKLEDALGDIAIYAMHLASNEGWDFQAESHQEALRLGLRDAPHEFERVDPTRMLRRMSVFAGRLFHAFLKREQGIRGTRAEHTEALRRALALLWYQMLVFTDQRSMLLEAVVSRTWEGVMARDWRNNCRTGEPIPA